MIETVPQRRARLAQRHPSWEPTSLAEHVQRCAQNWPERAFFICESTPVTYREFEQRSNEVAASLAGIGIEAGDRVGLLMRNTPDYTVYMAAIARIGAITVPLNYWLAVDELEFVVNDAELRLLVVDPEIGGRDMLEVLTTLHSRARGRVPASGAEEPTEFPAVVVRGDNLDLLENVIGHQDFAKAGDPGLLESWPLPDPLDIAEICYTSGSSGPPKGVLLRHDALIREGYGTAYRRGFGDGWRLLHALPPFHLFGYAQAILPASFVGGTVVLQPRFDPAEQLKLINEYDVNDVVAVPAMMQRVLDLVEPGDDFPSLTSTYISGNRVPGETWQRIMRLLGVTEISTGYGSTEMIGTTLAAPDDPRDALLNTIGRVRNFGVAGQPQLGGDKYEVRIVDPDTGETLGRNQVGELTFRGPALSPGYWKRPEETAERFVDGWYHTADLGVLRDDGFILLTGRRGEMFKTGGENVAPSEIEKVISELDGVRDAVVVSVPDARWSEAGFAWVVTADDAPVTVEVVDAHCRSRLANFKVPKHYRIISADELPLTASGKLDRAGLGAQARSQVPA